MKKIRKYFMLLLIIFLTGCSSYDMSMKIGKDKTMDYSVTVLSNSPNSEFANSVAKYKEKLEKYGYSVDEYNQENKYGMIITKHYDDIDDISLGKRDEEFNLLYFYDNEYDENIEKQMFNVDKKLDTNRYAANFYVDLSNLNIDLNNATVTFNLSLPEGNFSNNANNVSDDGKTLTWNITSSGKTEIDFVFELRSYEYLYYGIGVIIIIFLVCSILGNLFGGNNSGSVSKPLDDGDIEKKIENMTKNAIRNSSQKGINNSYSNNSLKKSTLNNEKKSIPQQKKVNVEIIPPKPVITADEQIIKNTSSVQNNNIFDYPDDSSNNNHNVSNKNLINNNEQLPNPFGNSVNNEFSKDSSSNNELFEIPVIGSDLKINTTEHEKQEENIQKIDSINDVNSGHNSSSIDSFTYQRLEEKSKTNKKENVINEIKDENDLDSHIDDNFTESIIKVNNKEVVVNKKKDNKY